MAGKVQWQSACSGGTFTSTAYPASFDRFTRLRNMTHWPVHIYVCFDQKRFFAAEMVLEIAVGFWREIFEKEHIVRTIFEAFNKHWRYEILKQK